MYALKRKHVNKKKSARTFRKHTKRTNAKNMQAAPQRGGYRL